jgi:hypothetical protein
MVLAAVKSAAKHTQLIPFLFWDGGEDPFLDPLRELDVRIVPHHLTFYDALEEHGREIPGYLSIASGAFLRTELPLMFDDDLVLYTDCDVLFTGPLEFPPVPPYFACASEFEQGNTTDFNTGVMLMNLRNLRRSLTEFQAFIREHLGDFDTYDQDAYRQFYGAKASALPDEYNWKPYWGRNPDARIVHFHGPKPSWAMQQLATGDADPNPVLIQLFEQDPPGYVHYLDRWLSTARSAGADV